MSYIDMLGRKCIKAPSHPRARKAGYVFEHTIIAEKAIGHILPEKAVVHHPYGAWAGNDNIVICENQTYHMLLHSRQRAYEATGDPHKRKCHYCKKWDKQANMVRRHKRREGYFHRACDALDHLMRRRLREAEVPSCR